MPRNNGAPIWPTMSTDDPPSNEEIVGHNLAVIGERLDKLTAAFDQLNSYVRVLFAFAAGALLSWWLR